MLALAENNIHSIKKINDMFKKLMFLFLLVILISCDKSSKPDEVADSPSIVEKEISDSSEGVIEQTEKDINADSIKGYEAIKDQLQGSWISTEDSNYVMIFKGDWVYDTYIGEEESEMKSKFLLSNKCPDEPEELTSNLLILIKVEDALCYTLDFVDDKNLQLTYLPRGNNLSFVKKK